MPPPDDTFGSSPTPLTEEPVFASRATAPRLATEVLDLGKAATRITLLEVTGPPAAPPVPPLAMGPPGDGPDLADDPAHDLTDGLTDGMADDMADDFGDDLDLSDDAGPDQTTRGFSPVPGDAPAMLDEDLLRDLVAQVVQQALQGELGERITRNVRKMVRREIYRVLASQELE